MSSIVTNENVIYGLSCICHPEKGIRYVGQTSRGQNRRLYEHKHDSSDGRVRESDRKLPVHLWISKHGAGNIETKVLQSLGSPDLLDQHEAEWIDLLDTYGSKHGLNLRPGGNTRRGWKHTEEVRAVISEAGRSRHSGSCKLLASEIPGIRKRIVSGETYMSIADSVGVKYGVIDAIAMGKNYSKVNDDGEWDFTLPSNRPGIQNGHAFQRKLTDSDIVAIVDRLHHGESPTAIAMDYPVTQTVIWRIAVKRGHIVRVKLNDEQRESIRMIHAVGERSYRSIGREFGVTHACVAKIVKSEGRAA